MREDDLDAAVVEGIIDRAQAIRLRHLVETRRAAEEASGAALPPTFAAEDSRPIDPDDERFRLIGGFNDVFVAIGVCLLAGALLGLTGALGFGDGFAAAAMIAAWGLSEVFARRMRLALPSILLAGMFAASAAMLVAELTGQAGRELVPNGGWVPAATAFPAAALLHHWRFRVPIDIALAAAGAVGIFLASAFAIFPRSADHYLILLLILSGVAVFILALAIDMSDPLRRTRLSDAAFWLHLLAAGLMVHPMFGGTMGGFERVSTEGALVVLGLFVLLGLVALIIDRRALLVSALSYAGIAITYLISQNVSTNLSLPLALLGLAVLVLTLSAGWRSLRAWLVPLLPLGRLAERLPPIALPESK